MSFLDFLVPILVFAPYFIFYQSSYNRWKNEFRKEGELEGRIGFIAFEASNPDKNHRVFKNNPIVWCVIVLWGIALACGWVIFKLASS